MRRQRTAPAPPPQLAEIVRLLHGVGRMLMEIDAKLQRIVDILEEET
ncbi:MAG TPA: hypothetical protein VF232_02400 [Gaiellaceae bacterium]